MKANIETFFLGRKLRNWWEIFETHAQSPSSVPEDEKSRSELSRLFYGNKGSVVHKWRHYIEIYERHLSRFQGRAVKMLEIGVSEGGSLSLWRKYLGPRAVIFGIDIDERCRRFDGLDAMVRIGSQADPGFLKSIVSEMGGVDVVLDDGSHVASHQRISFETLFPMISDRGIYICEDLHTAYWKNFEGGYRKRRTFIELAKQLVDDMHADFHEKSQGLENAHRSVSGIHFYNSIVVIEKRAQEKPTHIRVG
jgi:hypothetical protein